MGNKNIGIGYILPKPVITQEECDAYFEMANAINEHNFSGISGDYYWEIQENDNCFEIVQGDPFPTDDSLVKESAQFKIAESKTALSEYLASHPLQWTDGKYYSVTSDKQSLLTSNLSLYQLAVSNGQPFKLTWNSTGDECVEWGYEELAALALAIGTYVKPFVAHQQELELDIKACTTMEELDAIEINYDPVLEQYLETVGNTAGLKEVVE